MAGNLTTFFLNKNDYFHFMKENSIGFVPISKMGFFKMHFFTIFSDCIFLDCARRGGDHYMMAGIFLDLRI